MNRPDAEREKASQLSFDKAKAVLWRGDSSPPCRHSISIFESLPRAFYLALEAPRLKSSVFDSLAATVTFISWVPYFSCQTSTV